ncbi:uncharacterized protein [Henckelia pumila]|uniref:uncharacterized protein n=1 Tax=Henckelia pumila TaxID=405737 RepID=UPI003C6E46EB
MSMLGEWISASNRNELPQDQAALNNNTCRWTPPPPGFLKCNIDAAFFEDINQAAGVGMVVRDEEGLINVLLEVDAQQVYYAVKAKYNDLTEFGGIIDNCRNFLAIQPSLSVHFVRRQANEVAHVLARHSHYYVSPCVWVEAPYFIGELLTMYYANSNP